MELVIRQSERSGHQQRLLQAFTEEVFIFSLLALELLIYLLTDLLTTYLCGSCSFLVRIHRH